MQNLEKFPLHNKKEKRDLDSYFRRQKFLYEAFYLNNIVLNREILVLGRPCYNPLRKYHFVCNDTQIKGNMFLDIYRKNITVSFQIFENSMQDVGDIAYNRFMQKIESVQKIRKIYYGY